MFWYSNRLTRRDTDRPCLAASASWKPTMLSASSETAFSTLLQCQSALLLGRHFARNQTVMHLHPDVRYMRIREIPIQRIKVQSPFSLQIIVTIQTVILQSTYKVRGKLSAALDDTKSQRPNPMPKANRPIGQKNADKMFLFPLCTVGSISLVPAFRRSLSATS